MNYLNINEHVSVIANGNNMTHICSLIALLPFLIEDFEADDLRSHASIYVEALYFSHFVNEFIPKAHSHRNVYCVGVHASILYAM